ncbi:MAG TPA: ATP-binding protein [Chitinophagaceae bacterium]|nr:ATP-binding protein [Chitinophagaceae bacterium]
MKLLIFLFLSLCNYHLSLAQPDDVQPAEKDIIFVTRLLDSLPHFIRSGEAYLRNNPACDIPEHNSYYIRGRDFTFSKKALNLQSPLKRAYILMYTCYYETLRSYFKQDYASAKKLLLKALDISTSNDFFFEELHTYRVALNNIFFLEGDISAAMKISTEGLARAEKINDRFIMAQYNNVLGSIMLKLQNFEQARKYFIEQLTINRQINNKYEEAHALMNLADLSIDSKKMQEAKSYIDNAISVYRIYVAPWVYPEIKQKYIEDNLVYPYNKMSEVYKRLNKIDSALKYCLWTIHYTEKHDVGNLYDRASYYVNAGDIYNQLKKPDSALFYLVSGLNLARKIKHREIIRDAFEQISIAFALKNRFDSAYTYQQFFSKLKDSIRNENSEREILKRDAAMQVERQKRIQQVELTRQQLWRNIIIAISIFVIAIVTILYNRRRIKQKMLYQQQLNKQQNELMNTVINVQDKERKRIAEDLHDTLGSILSAAKLKLSAIADSPVNGSNGGNNYDDTMNLLDEAVNEMRNISQNLLPASLLKLGLVSGLKNLMEKISSASGLKINFIAHGFKGRLDETIEVSIYRIILEAINNVVKHAKAKNVTVQLVQYEDYINILVEDDGVGFDRSLAAKENGIGLNNIISRVDYMKGNIDIDTKPKAGTVINIDIPYSENSS